MKKQEDDGQLFTDSIEDGGLAFPRQGQWTNLQGKDRYINPEEGMTLRDYLAGQAIAGTVEEHTGDWDAWIKVQAKSAYAIADAMIKEREK